MSFGRQPGGIPSSIFRDVVVTKVIIALMIVSFFLTIIAPEWAIHLCYVPDILPYAIIGLLTYPLVIGDIFSLLITGFVVYTFGSSLERSWGSKTYLIYLLVSNIIAALVWELGYRLIIGSFETLCTPWLMLSTMVVTWALLNSDEQVTLGFVIPVSARWIVWLDIVILYFAFPPRIGFMQLVLGFFALGGIAFVYAYRWYRLKYGWNFSRRRIKPTRTILRHPNSTFWNVLTRPYREWQRKRRIDTINRKFKSDD